MASLGSIEKQISPRQLLEQQTLLVEEAIKFSRVGRDFESEFKSLEPYFRWLKFQDSDEDIPQLFSEDEEKLAEEEVENRNQYCAAFINYKCAKLDAYYAHIFQLIDLLVDDNKNHTSMFLQEEIGTMVLNVEGLRNEMVGCGMTPWDFYWLESAKKRLKRWTKNAR